MKRCGFYARFRLFFLVLVNAHLLWFLDGSMSIFMVWKRILFHDAFEAGSETCFVKMRSKSTTCLFYIQYRYQSVRALECTYWTGPRPPAATMQVRAGNQNFRLHDWIPHTEHRLLRLCFPPINQRSTTPSAWGGGCTRVILWYSYLVNSSSKLNKLFLIAIHRRPIQQ